MTESSLARVYAVLAAVVVFFVSWAAVAAHPWQKPAKDPRLAALELRRARLQHEALVVRRVVAKRYAAYRVALRAREREIARAKAAQADAARRAKLASAAVQTVTVYAAAAPAPAALPAAPPVVQVPAVTSTRSS